MGEIKDERVKNDIEIWLWGVLVITVAITVWFMLDIFAVNENAEAAKALSTEYGWGVILFVSWIMGLFISFILSIVYWIVTLIRWKYK